MNRRRRRPRTRSRTLRRRASPQAQRASASTPVPESHGCVRSMCASEIAGARSRATPIVAQRLAGTTISGPGDVHSFKPVDLAGRERRQLLRRTGSKAARRGAAARSNGTAVMRYVSGRRVRSLRAVKSSVSWLRITGAITVRERRPTNAALSFDSRPIADSVANASRLTVATGIRTPVDTTGTGEETWYAPRDSNPEPAD